jgi:protein-disulfide isomerase
VNHSHACSSLAIPPSAQDHIEGRLDARVVLVMYGDYQCSHSADGYKLIKAIQQQLSISLGEAYLCFIFRHFPQFHIYPQAQRAAEAAEAAQDQFRQMHEMLFNSQQALGDGYLVEYANHLGLNMRGFLQELSRGVHIAHIHQDIEGGIQSGVTVAPTLFINGTQYTDPWNVERLTVAITAASG